MMDAKKLVVAFLVLAALASSSALLLVQSTENGGVTASNDQNPQLPFTVSGNSAAPVASENTSSPYANAFVAPPQSAVIENAAGVVMAPATSSDNLTSQIIDGYLTEVINENPNVQADANGNVTLTAPSSEALLSAISSSSLLTNVDIPDWSAVAAAKQLNISTDTSPEAVAQYSNALNNIATQYIVKSGVGGMVSDSGSDLTLADISLIASQLKGALAELTAVSTPQNLTEFQKSLVEVATYDTNAAELTQNAPTDPVKASVIFQAEQSRALVALQHLQNAWEAASQSPGFSFNTIELPGGHKGIAMTFVNDLFGIPTAHAQYTDFAAFAQRVAEQLLTDLNATLLQLLKNQIINRLQNGALDMIRNSGNPLLIQAWGSFLGSTFNTVAGSALGQIFPSLCPNFSTNVSSWLKNAFSSAAVTPGGVVLGSNIPTNCTLSSIVPNTGMFFGNFNSYGINGFVALLTPSNNPFGSFIEGMDAAAEAAAARAKAEEDKSKASQGYKPKQNCGSSNAPSGSTTVCASGYLSGGMCYSQPNGQGTFIGFPTQLPPAPAGTCSNGAEALIHTPGITLASMLHDRLKSDTKLTANASAIASLLSSVLSNVITSAIQNTGLIN